MTQKVICKGCNEILYEGRDLKPPDEIIEMHNGKCPNCGKKISLVPHNVDVKPAPMNK